MRSSWLLVRRVGSLVSSTSRRPETGPFAAACAASALAFAGCLRPEEQQQKNAVLGGPDGRHRVAITNWTVTARKQGGLDETAKSFENNFLRLCLFLKEKGYSGVEFTTGDLRKDGFFPSTMGDKEVVDAVLSACQQSGIKVIGSLLHVTDGGPPIGASDLYGLDFNNPDFWERLEQTLSLEKAIGSEYATFQIDLPPERKSTGGAYRSDEDFLRLCAQRIHRMQQLCFAHGMNFYVETHIERISEDPEAFCRIFDLCPSYFEVNADISHYLYRDISRGPHFERIFARVGHTHVRMARKFGDLSAEPGVHMNTVGPVGNPRQDWEERGVTWQAMEAMRPALLRGLSSRAVVGESGPAFLVRDALELDVRLLPLYRAMASLADTGCPPQGNPFES